MGQAKAKMILHGIVWLLFTSLFVKSIYVTKELAGSINNADFIILEP